MAVAVPFDSEQAGEVALFEHFALHQEHEPVGFQARGHHRVHPAVVERVEHEGEDPVAPFDAQRVVDRLEVEDVEDDDGVAGAVDLFEHALGFPDEALAGITAGHRIVEFLLEQALELIVGARELRGNDLAFAHGAHDEGMADAPVFEHHFYAVDGFVDVANGVEIGLRTVDAVGYRAGRAGLVEAHEALVAFFAPLELGIELPHRLVEADDGVVVIDDVGAR